MNFAWLQRIKYPSGFVGKTSFTAMVFLVFCMVALLTLPSDMKIWVLPSGLVGFLLYLLVTHNFSAKNPVLATLEGSTAVAYLKADQAAKNPAIIDGSSTPIPPPSLQIAAGSSK